MRPSKKAKELVEKMAFEVCYTDAKQCALIAVDEIIQSDWFITTEQDKTHWDNYWQEVQQEIEKL
jgi:hypothetical protein